MQLKLNQKQEYCIDTSFIARLFESFPRDTYKTLWDNLEEAEKDNWHIICEVEEELKKKFPDEHEWCKKQGIRVEEISDDAFMESRNAVRDFPEWIKLNTTDLYFADPFLVGHARVNKCVVVTAEKREPQDKKKKKDIKLPDVCDVYKIECIGQRHGDLDIVPVNDFFARVGITA